jgi:periplasmic protein TonB
MAPSADVLRQYRLDLARAARQFRRFPGLAHDQTKEGDVLILVSFDLVSDKPVIELASSSAYPELDAEAVALFGMAVRSVSVPASLRGRPFSLSLMLRYSRRDE